MRSNLKHQPLGKLGFIITLNLCMLLFSCQKDEGITNLVSLKSTTPVDNTGYVTFFENELFVRQEGKPVWMTRQIGNSSIANYDPCFLLYVRSGYNGTGYVSSAVVKVDGEEILNASNFSNTNNCYQFQLCELTETSTLELVIMGAPGSTLEVWIDGKLNNAGTFTDPADGEVYKWVKIGSQTWMAENLRSTHYQNGDPILTIPIEAPMICEDPELKYQWSLYGNEEYVSIYGRYYTWYAYMDNRNICPTGWHPANMDDWSVLFANIEYSGELKATGTVEGGDGLWLSPNSCATNSTGFNMLPSGVNAAGTWYDVGTLAAFWLETMEGTYGSMIPFVTWTCSTPINAYPPCMSLPVRCVKDN